MKFRCGSSHQHSSKQQSDDEAKYSLYRLLISRSDRISVEPDEAEGDEMETYSNFDVDTQQNTAGRHTNIILLPWSHIQFVLKRSVTDANVD